MRKIFGEVKLKFLGTGGGRFSTITQARKTGGFLLSAEGTKIYCDPGPGALINSLQQKIKLSEIEIIFVSHAHTDHANDLNVIIEAITQGCTKRRGILIASESVIDGCRAKVNGKEVEVEKKLDNYHKNAMQEVINCSKEKNFEFKNLKFRFVNLRHNDPCTSGFILAVGNFELGYVADTKFFDELLKEYKGCDALIVNLLRPSNNPWKGHMTTKGAQIILNEIKPKIAVMQHFGLAILRNLEKEEKWLKKNCRSDTEIIFARDFQEIDITNSKKVKENLRGFL